MNTPLRTRAPWSALLLLLLLASSGWSAEEPEGRVILVAREEVESEELRVELASVGGEGATRFVLALSEEAELPGVDRCFPPKSREVANDRELCRRLGEVDVLVLRGGTFMQWFDTLFPEEGPTYLARTIVDRVRARRSIVAHGGACAFLCNGTSIPREDLEEPERNPRRREPFVPRVAMRLGPRAMIDSDDLPDGSPFRLLHALWETRLDLGFHLVGDVALDYRRVGGKVHVLGPGRVLVFDLDRARRKRFAVHEAHLSLLRRGDVWDQVFERPWFAGEPPGAPHTVEEAPRRGVVELAGAFLSRGSSLLAAITSLRASAARQARGVDGERRLELTWDEGTRVLEDPEGASILRLRIDCSWR